MFMYFTFAWLEIWWLIEIVKWFHCAAVFLCIQFIVFLWWHHNLHSLQQSISLQNNDGMLQYIKYSFLILEWITSKMILSLIFNSWLQCWFIVSMQVQTWFFSFVISIYCLWVIILVQFIGMLNFYLL